MELSDQPEASSYQPGDFSEIHQGLDFDDCFSSEIDSPSAAEPARETTVLLNKDHSEG